MCGAAVQGNAYVQLDIWDSNLKNIIGMGAYMDIGMEYEKKKTDR